MDKNLAKFGSYLDENLQHQVKLEATKRKVAIKDALEQAFLLWLGAPPKAESDWHRKLTEILASGDTATISAVTQNIEVFHDRLRPKRRAKAG